MANPSSKSEKFEIDYVANFVVVLICALLIFVAMVDFNSLTASLIALTISIVFVGHKIGKVVGKL